MNIVCLDLEGVLVPEIWIAFAEASGIPELKRTTRDEPDYDKLMKYRLAILKEHGLGIKEIQETIAKIEPMEGAKKFLDELRSLTQVIIISDTFVQFAKPLMAKLGYPTIFCNSLEVAEDGEINKALVKKKISQEVRRVLPKERPGDFNQALMDLGSSICIPNGEPFCENCPWESICQAHKYGQEIDFPVKAKKKQRKIEKKAVFLIEVSDKIILHKRPEKGLLSGLWELPNIDGELSAKELSEQMKKWGIGDYMIEPLGEGKHIFSHVEWQMRGYRLQMRDISEKLLEKEEWIAVSREDLEEKYAIPSAFECYRKQIYRG